MQETKKYDGLDKEYEFEALFGLKSDSGDVLGFAEFCSGLKVAEKDMRSAARSLVGIHQLPYPAFSSKHFSGKPLFHHAIEGALLDKQTPSRSMRVYKIRSFGIHTISNRALIKSVSEKINLLRIDTKDTRVGSGFRKDEILARWESLRAVSGEYTIGRFKAVVGSGAYIRSLVPLISEKLGTCGLVYELRRTKIGRFFPLGKNLGFWKRVF